MSIGILDLSLYQAHLMDGAPTFGEELRDWLARGLDHPMVVHDIQGGAPLPPLEAHDGFVVSGSEKGVYDDAWWMEDLRALVLAARDRGKPLLGICFGHQFLAHTFGGRAELSGHGTQCGVRWFDMAGGPVPAHVWHQDQVVEQPPRSRVIARADYCPFGGLEYDFPALSVQFHPESTRDYMGGFLERARGHIFDDAETDRILAEMAATEVAADLFAAEAGAFFRAHLPEARARRA